MPHRIDQMLSNNVGNKLTFELATGISATCRRVIDQIKAEYAAELSKIHGFSLESNGAEKPAAPAAPVPKNAQGKSADAVQKIANLGKPNPATPGGDGESDPNSPVH